MVSGSSVSDVVWSHHRGSRVELEKRGLTEDILAVDPVQVGSEARPEIAYTNEAGGSLLRSFRSMETQIQELRLQNQNLQSMYHFQSQEIADLLPLKAKSQQLEQELADLLPLKAKSQQLEQELANLLPLKAKLQQLEEESRQQKTELANLLSLKAKTKEMHHELLILHPLQKTAIAIRREFFDNFLRAGRLEARRGNAAIRIGNEIAQEGDVQTDIFLVENYLTSYQQIFQKLYGVNYTMASKLIEFPHMVKAMNRRATGLSENPRMLLLKDKEFHELVSWTLRADSQELALFTSDSLGRNHHLCLYLDLISSS
ncbi:hypothetical protein HOY82DRAFT_595806 [Tuber indicum]|nr:hypothetical protein HOY82DRAFT_595806 [Tuber indicum]